MADDIRVKIHNDLIIKNIERETNYAIKCDFDFVYLDVDDVKTLLENYKKQSKEIEELKEKNEYLPNWVNKKYVSKDEIKAKVIEIKNRPVKDEFITATQGKLNTIIEIESLLEKE